MEINQLVVVRISGEPVFVLGFGLAEDEKTPTATVRRYSRLVDAYQTLVFTTAELQSDDEFRDEQLERQEEAMKRLGMTAAVVNAAAPASDEIDPEIVALPGLH